MFTGDSRDEEQTTPEELPAVETDNEEEEAALFGILTGEFDV